MDRLMGWMDIGMMDKWMRWMDGMGWMDIGMMDKWMR